MGAECPGFACSVKLPGGFMRGARACPARGWTADTGGARQPAAPHHSPPCRYNAKKQSALAPLQLSRLARCMWASWPFAMLLLAYYGTPLPRKLPMVSRSQQRKPSTKRSYERTQCYIVASRTGCGALWPASCGQRLRGQGCTLPQEMWQAVEGAQMHTE